MYKLLFILFIFIFYSVFTWNTGHDLLKINNQNNRNNILVCDEIVLDEIQDIIEELCDLWFNFGSFFTDSNIQLLFSEKVFLNQVYQQDLKHLNPIFIDLPPPSFRF